MCVRIFVCLVCVRSISRARPALTEQKRKRRGTYLALEVLVLREKCVWTYVCTDVCSYICVFGVCAISGARPALTEQKRKRRGTYLPLRVRMLVCKCLSAFQCNLCTCICVFACLLAVAESKTTSYRARTQTQRSRFNTCITYENTKTLITNTHARTCKREHAKTNA
jgi:hypothetical protein